MLFFSEVQMNEHGNAVGIIGIKVNRETIKSILLLVSTIAHSNKEKKVNQNTQRCVKA